MPARFDLDHLSVPLNCGSLTLSHVTKGWTGGSEERRIGVVNQPSSKPFGGPDDAT